MRAILLYLTFVLSASVAAATSYLITLPQKLSYSCLIAHVRIVDVTTSEDSSDPTSAALVRASIVVLFKGPKQKEIAFSTHAYGDYKPKDLPGLVGKEFLVFLHDPYGNGEYWLFEGPRGMRPIQDQYSESRFDATQNVVTDTYSREQYLDILRKWEFHAESDKKEPNQRPEANAGKESASPTTPGPGVAHP